MPAFRPFSAARALAVLALAVLAACGEEPVVDRGPFAAVCSEAGVICTVAGDGAAGLGALGRPAWQQSLYLPMDVAFDGEGSVYVVDWNNHRAIRLGEGGEALAYAGSGELGGLPGGGSKATEAAIYHPTDLVFRPEGGAWIALWHNDAVAAIGQDGAFALVAGNGDAGLVGDGTDASTAALGLPSKIARRPSDGALCFTEAQGHRVRCVEAGVLRTIFGPGGSEDVGPGFGGDGGPGTDARLALPDGNSAVPAGGLCFRSDGALLVADTLNHRIRMLDSNGTVTTVAGSGPTHADPLEPGAPIGDGGPATAARLLHPTDVACAADGGFVIADRDHECVRAVDGEGVIHTVAGRCGERGADGDGGPATAARLNRPYGVALHPDGRLFVADTHNHRVRRLRLGP